MQSRQWIGQQGEFLAKIWLTGHGWQHVYSNYRCPYGEIDLILQQNDQLSIVEVRCRKQGCFGGAIDTINGAKQRKIGRTAQYFMQHHHEFDQFSIRFDVVAIDYQRAADLVTAQQSLVMIPVDQWRQTLFALDISLHWIEQAFWLENG